MCLLLFAFVNLDLIPFKLTSIVRYHYAGLFQGSNIIRGSSNVQEDVSKLSEIFLSNLGYLLDTSIDYYFSPNKINKNLHKSCLWFKKIFPILLCKGAFEV